MQYVYMYMHNYYLGNVYDKQSGTKMNKNINIYTYLMQFV